VNKIANGEQNGIPGAAVLERVLCRASMDNTIFICPKADLKEAFFVC